MIRARRPMIQTSSPADRRLDRLYSPPEIGAPGKRRARAERSILLYSGVFILSMLALVVVAFTLVIPGLLGPTYRIDAYFADAEALDVGLEVIQEGFVIGLVERVSPVFPSQETHRQHCPSASADGSARSPLLPCFRATLRIRDNWPVPKDSSAQLASLGLLKGHAVRVNPGGSSARLSAGEIIAVSGPEPPLTAQLATLTETVRLVIEESIAPALASIRAQVETIERLLGTEGEAEQSENRDRLAETFNNLHTLSESLAKAVNPEAITNILGSVETVSADLARITAEMGGSTQTVRDAVSDYGALAADIRAMLDENRPALQRSLDDTQFLLQFLAASLTPILTNIEDASRNLSAFSNELRNDPTSVIRRRPREEQAPWFR